MQHKKKVADGGTGVSYSTRKAKTDEEKTDTSTVNNVIMVGANFAAFEDKSTEDPSQAACTIPSHSVLEVIGHSCVDLETNPTATYNLWLNVRIEILGDATGITDLCEASTTSSYWVPFAYIHDCESSSLGQVLEYFESDEDWTELLYGPYDDESYTDTPGDKLSFEGGESNFMFKLICKFARKLLNEPDSFSYYSEKSQHDINDWVCGDAVVCQELAVCGSGFYLCPLKGFDWIFPEGESYGQRNMGVLIDRCHLTDTMVLCKDAKIPCSDNYGCNNIFEGTNRCLNGYCDWQKADFYFMCPEVSGE